jgi:predicted nuclease with TOPRIM domain
MSSGTGGKGTSKYKENKQALTKETNTLDNKHREMVRYFNQQRTDKDAIHDNIKKIETDISNMTDMKKRAELLDMKDKFETEYKLIQSIMKRWIIMIMQETL